MFWLSFGPFRALKQQGRPSTNHGNERIADAKINVIRPRLHTRRIAVQTVRHKQHQDHSGHDLHGLILTPIILLIQLFFHFGLHINEQLTYFCGHRL
jgi:hypothetical protein